MNVASIGAGGASISPMGGTNAASGAQEAGGHKQVNETIGDPTASSGAGTPYKSTDVLSDGTIKEMILMFLDNDSDKKDKGGNVSAFALANELYQAANQLQGAANISSDMGSMNSSIGQGGGAGGGMGGAMGGGAIAR
jgi:hypothetical protein